MELEGLKVLLLNNSHKPLGMITVYPLPDSNLYGYIVKNKETGVYALTVGKLVSDWNEGA